MPKCAIPRLGKQPTPPASVPDSTAGILPMLPLFPLDTPTKVLNELKLFWKLLDVDGDFDHPWLRQPRDEWLRETQELVELVNGGDDEALIKLIERDPRYLGFPVVLAKVLCWKLDIVYSRRSIPRPKDETGSATRRQVDTRAATADLMLKKLSRAIVFTEGEGRHGDFNRRHLLSEYTAIQRRVAEAAKLLPESRSGRRPEASVLQSIAAQVGLSEENVRELSTAPRKKQDLVMRILADECGLSAERIRALVRESQRAELRPWE